MKKLSQKELINETFAGMLGKMLKDTAKTAVKLATPTGGAVLSKAKKGISNLKNKFNEKPNTPEQYVDSLLRKKSNVVYDVRNIKSYKKGAQNFKLTNDPTIKDKLKNKPMGVGLIGKSDLSQTNLYIVDLELKLRNQKTYDPIDEWIKIQGMPVTYEEREGKIQYNSPINSVEDILKYIPQEKSISTETKEALKMLGGLARKESTNTNNTKSKGSNNKSQNTIPRPRKYRK